MSVTSRLSSQLGGSTNGDRSFNMVCPGNTIMSGVNIHSADKIDKLVNISCIHPKDILSGTSVTVNPSGWSGGSGGNNYSLVCPPGSAINYVKGTWAKGDTISSLQMGCRDLKTGNQVGSKSFGKSVSGGLLDTTSPNYYVGGFSNGNAGTLVDSTQVLMKDMTGLEEIYQKPDGTALACAGKYKDFNPYTKTYCDDYMLEFCKNNPNNVLCSCINSPVIKNAKANDPTFPNCPQIYDNACVTTGYKLAAYEKAKCDYQNCQVNFNAQPVDSNVNIVQVCNFKDGSSVTNNQGVVAPTVSEKALASFKSSPFMWIFLLILVILLPALGLLFLGGEDTPTNLPDTA